MKKKGFTLVELLAVIAILAILVIIALPNVISMFNSAKKNIFLTEARSVYKEVSKKYITESLKGNTLTEIYSGDDSKLDISSKNLDYCVLLDSQGKIEEIAVSDGNYYVQLSNISDADSITVDDVKEGTLDKMECGGLKNGNGASYIKKLYDNETTRKDNNLKKDNTKDQNIRYEGADPNNYVSFNGELWRIIGVFGNNIKLVRNQKLGDLAWDSSWIYGENYGYGVNEWSTAALKRFLNNKYYSGSTVDCYSGYNTTACPSGSLNATAKAMIDNHTWNTGAVDLGEIENVNIGFISTISVYDAERGTAVGNDCTSTYYCNDSITRTTTWKGYVGLPYASDWAYASSEKVCETNLDDGYDTTKGSYDNMTCKKNNWMHYGSTVDDGMWMISPTISYGAFSVMAVYGDGGLADGVACTAISFFPSVYLNSSVKIIGGTGTKTDPYLLEL